MNEDELWIGRPTASDGIWPFMFIALPHGNIAVIITQRYIIRYAITGQGLPHCMEGSGGYQTSTYMNHAAYGARPSLPRPPGRSYFWWIMTHSLLYSNMYNSHKRAVTWCKGVIVVAYYIYNDTCPWFIDGIVRCNIDISTITAFMNWTNMAITVCNIVMKYLKKYIEFPSCIYIPLFL